MSYHHILLTIQNVACCHVLQLIALVTLKLSVSINQLIKILLIMSLKQLVSWIFVLNHLKWLFLSPSASAVFAGRIETNESYYYVGETITLHCYAEKEFVDVKFTYLNRTVVPTQYVTLINNTYARMEKVAEATDPDRTSYDCWLDFNQIIAVASQVIETEYRPQNVINVTCIYYNKEKVFCTWDIGVQYKHASDVNVDPEWSSNPDVLNNWWACSSSTKTTCTINYYNNIFLSIRVNVTNRRRHDTAVLQHDINDVHYFIKTDPVQNLHIESVTSTCVTLSWKLLYSAMKFIVQYVVKGSQNYSQMTTESQSTNICNLRPNSLYTFIVKTHPLVKGYFSEPSVIDVQTKEDAPYSGPRITKGGYFRKPCTVNPSQVIVYFQPVKDEYKNGRVANYCAAVALDSGVRWTSCIDPEVSNQFVFGVNVTCNESFNISMYANTRVGSSPREVLSVPEMLKELENKTEEMDLQIMESGKGLYVATWNPLADGKMYTLFLYYCKESRISKICKGPMEHQRVNISSGKHEIRFEEADIFGLSLVTAENLTSGIHFTDCVYNPTSREIRKPKEPFCEGNTVEWNVKVKWTYERCDFSKKVKAQGYILKICRKKSSDQCIVYNIDNGSQSEFYVSHLQPQIEYTVTVTANTTSGLSEESDPASILLNPTTQDRNGMTLGVISTVLLALVFAGMLFACLGRKTYVRRLRRLECAHYPIPVATKNVKHPHAPFHPPTTHLHSVLITSLPSCTNKSKYTLLEGDASKSSQLTQSSYVGSLSGYGMITQDSKTIKVVTMPSDCEQQPVQQTGVICSVNSSEAGFALGSQLVSGPVLSIPRVSMYTALGCQKISQVEMPCLLFDARSIYSVPEGHESTNRTKGRLDCNPYVRVCTLGRDTDALLDGFTSQTKQENDVKVCTLGGNTVALLDDFTSPKKQENDVNRSCAVTGLWVACIDLYESHFNLDKPFKHKSVDPSCYCSAKPATALVKDGESWINVKSNILEINHHVTFQDNHEGTELTRDRQSNHFYSSPQYVHFDDHCVSFKRNERLMFSDRVTDTLTSAITFPGDGDILLTNCIRDDINTSLQSSLQCHGVESYVRTTRSCTEEAQTDEAGEKCLVGKTCSSTIETAAELLTENKNAPGNFVEELKTSTFCHDDVNRTNLNSSYIQASFLCCSNPMSSGVALETDRNLLEKRNRYPENVSDSPIWI